MKGVLVETDVIVDYLTAAEGEATLLRGLLQALPCYTTFIQAGELYSAARSDEEVRIVERALFGLKILGASARYAKTIGGVLSSVAAMRGHRTAIIAAMAIESQLPVVTDDYLPVYAEISGLRAIAASSLRDISDPEAIRSALASSL